MSCGLEHVSNCHGEVTSLIFLVSAGSLWLRIKYDFVKFWVKSFFYRLSNKNNNSRKDAVVLVHVKAVPSEETKIRLADRTNALRKK